MSRGLVWDIENSAFVIDAWGTYQADAIYVREVPQILTVAWQWVDEKKVHVMGQDDFKGWKAGVNDDKELVTFIRDELLDKCDYAVAHNGDRHDVKMLNSRMMVHRLDPPEPYKQIDTYKIMKRIGKFGSNSLKNLSKEFDIHQKGDAGSYEDTWLGYVAGDPKAIKKMKQYNKQDIPPLMDLYLLSRAWDKSGVQLNILDEKPDVCPKCGKGKIIAGIKYAVTKTNKYQYGRCNSCGGTCKFRIPEKIEKPLYVS